MRIVQINNFYQQGSTGKIVDDIHQYLCRCGHESYVLYGIGNKSTDPRAIRVTAHLTRKIQSLQSRITGFAYAGAPFGNWNILRILKRIKPDVVHLHCINGNFINVYKLLEYLKKNEIPTVITLHAEFLYTAGCGYAMECNKWKTGCHHCESIGGQRPNAWFFDKTAKEWAMMKKAYCGYEKLIICAVSDWLRLRALQSPFYTGIKIYTVLNGLNTNVFKRRDTLSLRAKLRIEKKKVILHVTPNFDAPIKGGIHVIEMAKRMSDVNVIFIVVGAKNINMTVPSNMLLVPHTSDSNELAEYYSLADICLLTSQKETFSMVCAESLCCGTPIVGFEAGAPETISLKKYSSFVKQGDDDALEKELRVMLEREFAREEIESEAKRLYDCSYMVQNYLNVYQNMYGM